VINAGIVGLGWWGKTLVEGVFKSSNDIQFVAGAARNHTDDIKNFGKQHDLKLYSSYEDMLKHKGLDAVVLATPHSLHVPQTIAAAKAGKHVFCEKPFALHGVEAREAVDAAAKAGVTLGLGYNRRWHPEMTKLRNMIKSGELGVILHCEATMTFPNALLLKADAWRASREETPCGGLTPMGVHAVDGMIDLCGAIDEVYCQSFRRAVSVDADDTTSILFRMKEGMSGYLGTMTATGGGFSFQVYGSKGYVRLEGMTHVAGASSEERRTRLFGNCTFKPTQGPAKVWQAEGLDVTKATLEAFGRAAAGKEKFLIPVDEMVHGAAVTEAIIRSAETHLPEKVRKV
jgi:predicted dehydrogenase